MAEQWEVEIGRLVSHMEETRQAIARTTGELADRVRRKDGVGVDEPALPAFDKMPPG